MGFFSKKKEAPVEGNELYTDRRFNTFWMLGLSPFRELTDEEFGKAMDSEIRKITRVLGTNPVDMVKVKTEQKLEKLNYVKENASAIDRDRDQAILMFNEDMVRSIGSVSTDPEQIKGAIVRTGWKDGLDLLSVEGMPQCRECGYINRATKKCIKCGKRL